jgi:uncharacterized protein (UPF0264 family)
MPKPHARFITLVVAASVLAPASAQAATDVEMLTAATPVAAYDGTAMWSRLDAATGKYQLVQSKDGGAAVAVAVAQRDGPFDVDLGPNISGTTYAVYSRDGDIYRLNPRTGIETKLVQLSSPNRIESNPSIQGRRIAFVRSERGLAHLRIADTASGAKSTRLLLKAKQIQSIELGTKHVAWVGIVRSDLPSRRFGVHIRNISTGKQQLVYQAGGGGASFTAVSNPSFVSDSASFIWAVARQGAPGSRIVKYTLRTSKLSYAQGTASYASVAWLSSALGALVSNHPTGYPNAGVGDCGGGRECSIQITGPLTFNLKP